METWQFLACRCFIDGNAEIKLYMTTLSAWVGVDQRSPSSLYIVTDSRLTALQPKGGNRPHVITDSARKIYTCRNEPHLFGYCGWVKFPVSSMVKLVALIDQGGFFAPGEPLEKRQAKVALYLENQLENVCDRTGGAPPAGFVILHAGREAEGMTSVFRLWIIGWSPNEGWKIREREISASSEILFAGGSGGNTHLSRAGAWQNSEIGRTSRGVFSAFCEALQSGRDEYSGGPPQLGGLFRRGRAMEFGIVSIICGIWQAGLSK